MRSSWRFPVRMLGTLTVDATGSAWRYRLATDVDGLVRTELVEAEEATLQATSGAAIAAVGVGSALLLGFDT